MSTWRIVLCAAWVVLVLLGAWTGHVRLGSFPLPLPLRLLLGPAIVLFLAAGFLLFGAILGAPVLLWLTR